MQQIENTSANEKQIAQTDFKLIYVIYLDVLQDLQTIKRNISVDSDRHNKKTIGGTVNKQCKK